MSQTVSLSDAAGFAPAADAAKWSPARTLGFVFATCGGFWLIAAAAFLVFH